MRFGAVNQVFSLLAETVLEKELMGVARTDKDSVQPKFLEQKDITL